MSAFPLGNILTGIGSFGMLAMLPHMILPNKMCKLFLEEKFTTDKTSEAQLTLLHFGLFSNLFFLAATIAVAGQSCPRLPVAIGFIVIIIIRVIAVFVAFRNDLLGLAKKPVMLQVIIGTVLVLVAIVSTVLAAKDEGYLAASKAMEATAFDKMETAAPLVYFLIGVSLFFALMSAPGICFAEQMIDGYIPSALRLADKYARAQMKFYMSFQSREQFFFWLLLAALVLMSPDITAIGILICVMAAYFMGFCVHCITNISTYGFALPGMLFWLISMALIFGCTSMGLLLL